jgi:hypothetical protein
MAVGNMSYAFASKSNTVLSALCCFASRNPTPVNLTVRPSSVVTGLSLNAAYFLQWKIGMATVQIVPAG